MGRPRCPEEVEVKLAAVGPCPRAVMERIRVMERIGRFRLMPSETQAIDDRYYDTPQGELGQRGLALRVRNAGDVERVTLKFPSEWDEYGLTRRGELELPWSAANWNSVRRRLAEQGVVLKAQPAPGCGAAAMDAAGLAQIQRRDTFRDICLVVDTAAADSREATALLCLDETSYHCAGCVVRRFEVEIETLGAGVDTAVELARLLGAMFPDQLMPWPYGKLATGKAIEALLRTDFADAAVTGEDLTAQGYRLLRGRLERRANDHGTGECWKTPSAT
jgi:hypothetical protein